MIDESTFKQLERVIKLEVKNINTKLESADKALRLQREETERRLEGLNELRKEYTRDRTDDRDIFLKKELYEVQYETLRVRIDELAKSVAVIESKQVKWFSVIAIIFIVLELIMRFAIK